MNRKMRRQLLRQQKSDTVIMTREDKREIVDKANKNAWENILPIFLLYLVDHFHCKQNGIGKFMDWFNQMDAWVGGDHTRLKQLIKEVNAKANTEIEYVTR